MNQHEKFYRKFALGYSAFWLFVAFIGLFVTHAYGSECEGFYPLSKPVSVANGVELCNSFYVVQYDEKLNGAIFSAEKFRAGTHPERLNDFHPDYRLSNPATHRDYLHSGFDQGHMTPAADATNETEMHDSFLLSNMSPQEPTLNREAWRILEEHVRTLDPDYILTGNIYGNVPKRIGAHQVPVPDSYYKLAWKDCQIHAWYAENKPHATVEETTIEIVEVNSGLTFPRCEK
ncbi:NUC1 DNA/RNA endonuclease G, NUC1 [uncultured Caudovirales phage]|uniref:NUC1 DNA/RNA endonuclease G, NUC1 n=1 Tax=uncultured Caudovirales phage TaxID=2100421 RepID=A0A6J5LFQ3_9CAUD|nr:NUC1 DNA/RNA endonuclease G, NUC1 [uncultured Caudovirales phage]